MVLKYFVQTLQLCLASCKLMILTKKSGLSDEGRGGGVVGRGLGGKIIRREIKAVSSAAVRFQLFHGEHSVSQRHRVHLYLR